VPTAAAPVLALHTAMLVAVRRALFTFLRFIMKITVTTRKLQGTGASRRLRNAGSTTGIVYGGAVAPVQIQLEQMHPFNPLVLHVDFQRVNANEEITMSVPLHFVGQEVSPAVKLSASIISHVATKVTIACLPAQLPEFITVDLSKMEAGKSLHTAELVMPEGVRAVIKAKTNPVIAAASAAVVAEEPKA
jgi:large subunit ribosomal protein L25